jgi:uncharacterized protein
MIVPLHAQAVAPFVAEVGQLRPPDADVIDAHTHLGRDEDGRAMDPATLLRELDDAGASRACVFPLHDPDRHPAYRAPNDRVLEWAAESDGRLIPFCRLDPADEALAEGERCLDAGARGIKLHPRAQSFAFGGDVIDGIFELAEQAHVPILIHAGRGMPPIADGLADVALRHPGAVLILAHAGIADQGILTTRLAGHAGVLYDISTWSPFDVIELFGRVPPERVVFGSDPPYGHPATTLYMALRVAREVGLDEQQTRLFLGGTMTGLLDEHILPEPTPPLSNGARGLGSVMARLFSYCLMAGPALYAGHLDMARGSLDLALAVCRDPRPGPHAPALAEIGAALTAALAMLRLGPPGVGPALDLVHRCLSRAATEPVQSR